MKMKKLVLSACCLVLGALTAQAATQTTTGSWTKLDSSTGGQELKAGYYYITANTTCDTSDSKAAAGTSGLTIASGATVYIYIPSGVTLTCTGKAGSGTTGGGAGIYLPSNSTLYLLGNGEVKATGGKGGAGGKGGNGTVGTAVGKEGVDTGKNFYWNGWLRSGPGGKGGAGGGGGGAGIGTPGASGRDGGDGGASATSYPLTMKNWNSMTGTAQTEGEWQNWYRSLSLGNQAKAISMSLNSFSFNVDQSCATIGSFDGKGGVAGGASVAADAMGNLYRASTLKVTATAGGAGSGGAKGNASETVAIGADMGGGRPVWYQIGSSGGGGGGGGGYAGAAIGTGGKSGAGGGGGGTGSFSCLGYAVESGNVHIDPEKNPKNFGNGGGGAAGAGGTAGTAGGGTRTGSTQHWGDNGTGVNPWGGDGGASGKAGDVGSTKGYSGEAAVKNFTVTLLKSDGKTKYDNTSRTYAVNGSTTITLPTYTGYSWQNTVYGKACAAKDCDLTAASTATMTGKINVRNVYGDITFQAVPNSYTVTFDRNGGAGGTASTSATFDAALPAVTVPTRAGYVFRGYFNAAVGGTKIYSGDGKGVANWTTAANTTLYAQWKYAFDRSLPGGYTEIGGIKSSGAQYIDTGYIHAANTKIECSVDVSSSQARTLPVVFGSFNGSKSSKAFNFFARFNGDKPCYGRTGAETSGTSGSFPYDERVDLTCEGKVASWRRFGASEDCGSITTTGTPDAGGCSMAIFVINNNGTKQSNSWMNMTLYSFKISEDGVVMRDFVPCKNGSAVGLYDHVTEQFYGNSGSGAFAEVNVESTVTLDANGGAGGDASVSAKLNCQLPTVAVPTKAGCAFRGYFDAAEGGVKYYSANGRSARPWDKSGAATLYAQWKDADDRSLPAGCTAIGALQSSGTQYVDTLYVPTLNTCIEADMNPHDDGKADWLVMFGVTSGDSAADGVLCRYTKPVEKEYNFSGWFCNVGPSSSPNNEVLIPGYWNTRFTVEMKSSGMTVSNETAQTHSTFTSSGKTPYADSIYLFCGNNGGAMWRNEKMDLYSFKITEGDVTMRDYVPCKSASGEFGLYDYVTEEFYGNLGSGTFAAVNPSVTVTLDANGGEGGAASVTATFGSAMPTVAVPTKDGAVFHGYYDAAEGGKRYYIGDGTSATLWDKTVATTLYAQWKDAADRSLPAGYTELAAIEATGTQYLDTGYRPEATAEILVRYQLTAMPTASNKGYVFGEWTGAPARLQFAHQADGKGFFGFGNTYDNTTIDLANDLDIHVAAYTNGMFTVDGVCKASFSTWSGTAANLWLFACDGNGALQDSTAGFLRIFSCEIYSHAAKVRDYVPCKNAEGEVGLYDLITERFYGNGGTGEFLPVFAVTFDANGGTVGDADALATFGKGMPTVAIATRPGYDFVGYFDAAEGGKQYYAADGTSAADWDKSEATTLFAQWKPSLLTLAFDFAGGEGGTVSTQANYLAELPAVTPPVRTGYTFAGHFDGAAKIYEPDGSTTNFYEWTSDWTLTSQWKANSYKYVLDAGEAGFTNELAVTFDAVPSKVRAPVAENLKFLGYFDADDNMIYNAEGEYVKTEGGEPAAYRVAGNTTLVAKWGELTEEIEPVSAKQRWPWNGKYDIVYEAKYLKASRKYVVAVDFTLDEETKTATVAIPSVSGKGTLVADAEALFGAELKGEDLSIGLRLLLDEE